MTLPAWEVEINGWVGIVGALTAPKARWIAVASYREAGYGHKGVWPSVTAVRRPCFDDHPELLRQPRIFHGMDSLR